MTFEARLAFILFFTALWCALGLIPWTVAAVLSRGRGALLALPLAVAGAAAAGVLVPVLGFRDTAGFLVSLPVAVAGGALAAAAGMALGHRLSPAADPSANEEPRSR